MTAPTGRAADIHYCNAMRAKVKAEHPGMSIGEVGRELGRMWQQEPLEVRKARVREWGGADRHRGSHRWPLA